MKSKRFSCLALMLGSLLLMTEKSDAAPATPLAASGLQGKSQASPRKINIRKQHSEIDALLQNAYLAYQEGRKEASYRLIEQILAKQPEQTDALLAASEIENSPEGSPAYLLRALKSAPDDPRALARLAERFFPPAQAESRLINSISAHAEDANLYFALGNLLAGQERWSEALEAYRLACARSSEQAAFHYNQAIALEHLQRLREAVSAYQKALTAPQPGPLTTEMIRQRLSQLGQ